MNSEDLTALKNKKVDLEKEIRRKTFSLIVDIIDFVLSIVVGVGMFIWITDEYNTLVAFMWIIPYCLLDYIQWKVRRIRGYRLGEGQETELTPKVCGSPIEIIDPRK